MMIEEDEDEVLGGWTPTDDVRFHSRLPQPAILQKTTKDANIVQRSEDDIEHSEFSHR